MGVHIVRTCIVDVLDISRWWYYMVERDGIGLCCHHMEEPAQGGTRNHEKIFQIHC